MDAIFFTNFRDVQFTCNCCGWIGSELELDVLIGIELNLVCCPTCQNDDVRVMNTHGDMCSS